MIFEVAIIGAGVVGSALARELSLRGYEVVVIEANSDVGAGISKANTAILHTGFDAMPHSVEANLVRRGHDMLLEFSNSCGIAIEKTNALMIAWNEEQLRQLDAVVQRSHLNGHDEIEKIDSKKILELEPNVSITALGGLMIRGEYVIDPWSVPLAFIKSARAHGAVLQVNTRLIGVEVHDEVTTLQTTRQKIQARFVVNAGGLGGGKIDQMFALTRFVVTPRRGELVVFDKWARRLVSHIILPVPMSYTKGILITPTVFGNLMAGPTAQDIADDTDTGSTNEGIKKVIGEAYRIVPELAKMEVTAIYSGLRAATEEPDYRIFFDPNLRYVCIGGIRSTGLSASMALAEIGCQLLVECGLEVAKRPISEDGFVMPPLGENQVRPSDLGESCICHCERVTPAEIVEASRQGASTLDGIRRRTRALNGQCQGFYCLADICQLLAKETGVGVEHWLEKRP